MDFLFGYRGRLNRAKYWLAGLIYVAVTVVPAFLLLILFNWAGVTSADDLTSRLQASTTATVSLLVLIVLFIIVWVGTIVSSFMVAIRRLHDRDKSGWWVVTFYVLPGLLSAVADGLREQSTGLAVVLYVTSLAITIWAIVELGFLRGTDGANRFGSDPLRGAPAYRAARL
jgi:uncharacterized membrane protein YhaH (DUF805 family)